MSIIENFGKYKIGAIVTIKSNHLKSVEQYQEILLAGEPNFVTPLMIVSEILKIKTEIIDEATGVNKNSKGEFQYKCIWFSNKSFKLEEQWFYEKELICIDEDTNDHDLENPKFSFGDNLVIKTNRLELQKRKTYLDVEKDKTTNKISSLLTFCSPVFILIGYSSVNQKEPLIDTHTGKRKREYCTKLVKVKSFNVKDDKYSEFLIPIEAVEKINEIDENILQYYFQAKENTSLIVKQYISNSKTNIIDKIFYVNSVTSISNVFKAEIRNVFSDMIEIIEIQNSDLKLIEEIESQYKYPQIYKDSRGFKIKSIEDELRKILKGNTFCKEDIIAIEYINKLKNKKLVKIVYKNKFDKITTRFCIPIYFFSVTVKKYSQKEDKEILITEYYVQSFCLLRKDYRNFKVDRIMSLELIENDLLKQFAYQIWLNYVNNK
jgi:hypothetical protein